MAGRLAANIPGISLRGRGRDGSRQEHVRRARPPGLNLAASRARGNEEYRHPFAGPREDRWPTLSWPREIPIDGQPASVAELGAAYAGWMAENDIPKQFVNADPGAILVGDQREFCRSWRNQTEVTVAGSHFIQEDSGAESARTIAAGCARRAA